MMIDIAIAAGCFAGAYLLGSVPFGLVLTRMAGLGDIRKIGSGNIGATNVLRTGRKDLALATLVLDAVKGAVAVIIAAQFGLVPAMAAAVGSVLGHLFPVWLRFKGGKGVATTLGVLLALVPLAGLGACLIWAAVAAMFRISSLSALVAMAAAPVFAGLIYGSPFVPATLIITVLVWVRHIPNIRRLLDNREPRIGEKPAPAATTSAASDGETA